MGSVKTLGWLSAVLLAGVFTPALAVTDAERIATYKEFRAQFDAKQYAAAQPLAERLVQLTEEQYGAEELQLTNPLTNLATVHYKLGNFPAAIENYQRTLRILQTKSTIGDKAQIRPLHGLGISFIGARDPESAVVVLKRAADLSRNTDGLFNIGQVEFIDALIDAYGATGRWAEAEKESLYAKRVEEAAYGRNSIKLLDRYEKLARFYEADRRYTSERVVYEMALSVLQRNAPENDMRRVGPLRGLARSFRLEAFYGVEGADTGATFNAGTNGAPVFSDGTASRRGETTLATALQIIDSNTPVNHELRGQVLTDLGDWFLSFGQSRRAFDTYAEAWKSLVEAGNTKLLENPRLLTYRPSISSVDRSQLDPAQSEIKVVEMHFRVERDGRIEDVSSPTKDVSEMVVKNSMASMKRSRFAPRIENGLAVPTDDVVFIERVLIKVTSPEGTSSDSAGEKKPAEEPKPAPPEAAPASPPLASR
jgi:tetratricopeptide (TPR) repeat protein